MQTRLATGEPIDEAQVAAVIFAGLVTGMAREIYDHEKVAEESVQAALAIRLELVKQLSELDHESK